MRPKILIPLASFKNSSDAIYSQEFARETYICKIVEQNLEPVFVSSFMSQDMIDEMYKECSGILFMGGSDINPKQYGEKKHIATVVTEEARDILEIDLARRAIKDRKPILGICRGLQILAVATHGTLHQHIPDIVQDEPHGVSEGGNYDTLASKDNGHEVNLLANTKIHSLIGKGSIHVNSGHHQAINKPGEEMIVSGLSPKGIIEVMEHKDSSYFCFGIQSHPEAGDNMELAVLFPVFAKAVTNKT